MRLYFLRHGSAEDHQAGLADADRRLTPEGAAEMQAVATGMKNMGLQFDQIYTSPLTRALETASIVAQAFGIEEQLQVSPLLACGAGRRELSKLLSGCSSRAQVLVVGHEPDFSSLISLLVGGGNVRMKKASLARVDLTSPEPGAGELRWLMTAEQISTIASPSE